MNKVTPVNSIRAKHWPKVGRLPDWNNESSLSAEKLHVPDNFAPQINRGTKPVNGETNLGRKHSHHSSRVDKIWHWSTELSRCTGKQTYLYHRYEDPTSCPGRWSMNLLISSAALFRSRGIHCISMLTPLRRQVWKMPTARFCNAGTLEPELTIRTTFWLSMNQVTD